MTISSRTPEGDPYLCPLCGQFVVVETSQPAEDSLCPRCGHLLWRFRDLFGSHVGLHTSFTEEIGADSLDLVELVMELEEEFDVTISDEDAEKIRTVEDAIRIIQKYRDKKEE